MRGAGRATFAAVLLLIAGTINIIYGIGALDSANIYANDTRYIFTNLNTMGWVLIVLGVIELAGGFSLYAGNTFGRVLGLVDGALDDANIFVNDTRFILNDLNTLGWVLIVLGVIQLTAGFSLMAGNTYGRVLGIAGASLGAIGALLSIGGSNPWWSLAVFALCVYIIQGILVLGEDDRRPAT